MLRLLWLLCFHAWSFPNEFCVQQWGCQEDCVEPLSHCCRASQLTQRLHHLDSFKELWTYHGLTSPDPADVHQLCLDFLQFPRGGGSAMEQHLTRCSRAMLNMAFMADALHHGEFGTNKTCSEMHLKVRYPMSQEDEWSYIYLAEDRFWLWYVVIASRWQVLAMLANHTARCTGQHVANPCAAFNPWQPYTCFAHHELIQAWSPSCQPLKPKIPRRPPSTRPTDWLGVQHQCGKRQMPDPQVQLELTRQLECWGLPWGPLPGEDYFETISLLTSLSRWSRSGAERDFVLMEAGSSIGFWSLKAAKAFRQLASGRSRSCRVILIDSDCPKRKMVEHLSENHIYDLCNISLFQEHLSFIVDGSMSVPALWGLCHLL